MQHYNDELKRLQEKITRKSKLMAMMETLKDQICDLESSERQLAIVMNKEQLDVDKLEGKSLAALYYTLLGNKETKIEKEQIEARTAVIKHDAVMSQLEAVRYDFQKMKIELSSIMGSQAKYDQLLALKTEALKREDPINATRIIDLEKKMSEMKAQQKEIDEAIVAGKNALSKVDEIHRELNSAEGWGMWDLLGGGLISDLAKHSHLDQAQRDINDLQILLQRFHTELADVKIDASVHVQVDGFLRFADYFFDGLIADWTVLDHIQTSQSQINTTRSQVESVLDRLKSMAVALEVAYEGHESQLKTIVLSA